LAGNIVTSSLYINACGSPATPLVGTGFTCDLISFELYADDLSCETVENTSQSLPYILNFEYPLCFSDYNSANLNKKGYININGYKYWIKELRYINNKKSVFTLMGNDLICN